MKMLSLFSGSGGFELAGRLCGIMPVAAAEILPYSIAVTRKNFPDMKHLGDVRKIKGDEIEPVLILQRDFVKKIPCENDWGLGC